MKNKPHCGNVSRVTRVYSWHFYGRVTMGNERVVAAEPHGLIVEKTIVPFRRLRTR